MTKNSLFGKTLAELQQIVADANLPSFTAKQIAQWLYHKKAVSIDEITNLSKKAQEAISEKYEMGISFPTKVQESVDGTKKYLFETRNNCFIESVYLPEENRNTLCISSQVGCKMNCDFCIDRKSVV